MQHFLGLQGIGLVPPYKIINIRCTRGWISRKTVKSTWSEAYFWPHFPHLFSIDIDEGRGRILIYIINNKNVQRLEGKSLWQQPSTSILRQINFIMT
jgi:hypothetical protein